MNKYFNLLTSWTDIIIEEIKTCKYCWKQFPITSIEKQILDKHSFKYPENCPLCTFRILYSYINDKRLYKRKDSENNKDIISILSDYYDWKVIEADRYKKYLFDDLWLKFWKEISEDISSEFKKLYKIWKR